jgi:hypothetical protein
MEEVPLSPPTSRSRHRDRPPPRVPRLRGAVVRLEQGGAAGGAAPVRLELAQESACSGAVGMAHEPACSGADRSVLAFPFSNRRKKSIVGGNFIFSRVFLLELNIIRVIVSKT